MKKSHALLSSFCVLSLALSLNTSAAKAKNNTAPVVNAGADQSIIDNDKNGTETVVLRGSATDAQKNILAYRLYKGSALIASSSSPTILQRSFVLAVGTHTFTMEAIDSLGLRGVDSVVVTISAPKPTNTAPVVNAGPDQTVEDTDNNGSQPVWMQGSATDAQNNITSYRILENGFVLTNGTTAFTQAITLSVGSHTLVFEATDAQGLKGTDTVVINVTAGKPVNTAPVVNAGADRSVEDTDGNGSQSVVLQGSAIDAQNNITLYRVLENGTVLASGAAASTFTQSLNLSVGSHTLLLEATDAQGLKGSDSVAINVTPQVKLPPSGSLTVNAGPDIKEMVNGSGAVGVNKIQVTGSASGSIASYRWKVNGVVVARSASAAILTSSFFFIQGTNLLTLEVSDASGVTVSDSAWVEVVPGLEGSAVAVASAGGTRIIVDNDQNGLEAVRMTGSVNTTQSGVSYRWMWRGQTLAAGTDKSVLTANVNLPVGGHNIRLEVLSNSGSVIASDGVGISVSAPVIENPSIPIVPRNFNLSEHIVPISGVGASHWKDLSAFRFHCKPSHLLYDDPIVYPGQKGKSHLHMFFGNNTANADSTYESLRLNGTSSCHGGPLNRSAYWMPAVVNENGKVILPDYITIYYKTSPGAPKLPRGLRTVFGWNPAKPTQVTDSWKCSSGGNKYKTIPEVGCPATTADGNHLLMAELNMPGCWDGKNLDSADHRSHIVHADYSNGWGSAECPATHPVIIPHFTMVAAYSHTGSSEYSKWRLSSDVVHNPDSTVTTYPAGSTLHADWFGAWDDEVMQKWMDGCINNFMSCSAAVLNGTEGMKWNTNWSWTTSPRIVDPPMKPLP